MICLIPIAITIYYWLQYRSFLHDYFGMEYHFGLKRLVVLGLSLTAPAYFFWHAYNGQPAGASERYDSVALAVVTLFVAISFTLIGLGYQHHTLKIIVVSFFYTAAAFFFWCAHNGYPVNLTKYRN